MKVYLVHRFHGEYDDYHDVFDSAWSTLELAQKQVEKVTLEQGAIDARPCPIPGVEDEDGIPTDYHLHFPQEQIKEYIDWNERRTYYKFDKATVTPIEVTE